MSEVFLVALFCSKFLKIHRVSWNIIERINNWIICSVYHVPDAQVYLSDGCPCLVGSDL